MSIRRNILDPPEDATPAERRHWVRSFAWFQTMFAGEDFWDEVHGRNKYSTSVQDYDFILSSRHKTQRKRMEQASVGNVAPCNA